MTLSEKDLNVLYDNWYSYQLGSPTPEQENEFWSLVFNTEEKLVKEKILNADLDYVLQAYIQTHEKALGELETSKIFEKWWGDVVSPHKCKCAHVLHTYLSKENFQSAQHPFKQQRVEDMFNSEQWDNALHHHDPNTQPHISWKVLSIIMENKYIHNEDWEHTLHQLDVYLKKGGLWEENPPVPGQSNHILLTPLASRIAENNDAEKLYDLYARGIHPNNMTVWSIPSFGKKDLIKENITNAYNQYLHKVLTQAVGPSEKEGSSRKM